MGWAAGVGLPAGGPTLRAKTEGGRQWSLVDDREQLLPPHLPSGLWEENDGGVIDRALPPPNLPLLSSAPAPKVFQGKEKNHRQWGAPRTRNQEGRFQVLPCCVTCAHSEPPSPDL